MFVSYSISFIDKVIRSDDIKHQDFMWVRWWLPCFVIVVDVVVVCLQSVSFFEKQKYFLFNYFEPMTWPFSIWLHWNRNTTGNIVTVIAMLSLESLNTIDATVYSASCGVKTVTAATVHISMCLCDLTTHRELCIKCCLGDCFILTWGNKNYINDNLY